MKSKSKFALAFFKSVIARTLQEAARQTLVLFYGETPGKFYNK
jgi:hypothetical protein